MFPEWSPTSLLLLQEAWEKHSGFQLQLDRTGQAEPLGALIPQCLQPVKQ